MNNKYRVTNELIEKVVETYKKTASLKETKRVLQMLTGWGKTKVAETVNKLIAPIAEKDKYKTALAEIIKTSTVAKSFPLHAEALEDAGSYVYNRSTDQYVVPNKKTKSGYIVLNGNTVRAIRSEYTDGANANDMATKHNIPKECVSELLQRLEITHEASSITDEELAKTNEQLIADGVAKRKFDVEQAIEKEVWKETQRDATKWREFEYNQLIPFENYLKNWNPPQYKPTMESPKCSTTGRTLIIGAFDWHIGGLAEEESLLKGRDWNIEEAKKSVIKYATQLEKHRQTNGYDKAVLILGGDLFNSLTGFTANNTPVGGDRLRETQFNAVSECLIYFIESVLNMFASVEVHFVKGNHGGLYDYLLGAQLKAYFRTERRLEFNNYQSRHAFFMVGKVFCIAEHGAASDQKHLVPKDGTAREAYIQNLILAKKDMFINYKQCLFVMGDQHHTKYKDEGTHIFFQSGALPCGDKYAETMAKRSRPTQTCIAVDENGISGFHHFYFD